MWEDHENRKGGKWQVVTPSSVNVEVTLKTWFTLMITLLIGEFGFEEDLVVILLDFSSNRTVCHFPFVLMEMSFLSGTRTPRTKKAFGLLVRN